MKGFKWVLLFIIFGCNPDKSKKVELNQVNFSTSESSELFFRNIRQTYYNKTRQQETNLEIYRLKKLEKQGSLMVPTIVNNWRYDQAYLIIEFNNPLSKDDEVILLWNEGTERIKARKFEIINKESHFRLATTIFNHLLDEDLMMVKQNNDTLRLFDNNEEREGFRITMVDYYRLVNIYR